jgi:vacuolar-type H+-ATPase subunit H
MPTLRDLLRRWRPADAPGAAARAGVPCDRTPQPELELADVLGARQSVQAECRTIRDAARDAHLTTMRAQKKAQAIIGDARTTAAAERAVIVADAERLAARIRARADQRMPATIARAVELVKKEPP